MAKAPVLTPRADDFPRWYQDLINKAELADNGPVRGTMVIRPYGYGLWERMQAEMDARIKETVPRTRTSRCSSRSRIWPVRPTMWRVSRRSWPW